MMWVVYDTQTVKIVGKFYSKAKAKDGLLNLRWQLRNSDLDLSRYDLVRHEEWVIWKTLTRKTQ